MVSDIEIRLRADIARLQQDMNNARQAVGSSLDKINTAVGKTVGMLGGLAVGAGAVSFVRFIKGSIDAADALNDLSNRTQVAVEDLAGLNHAAKQTGTTLDGVAGAVNKLSANIGKDTEKFRELGISASDPVEAFKQLADIFKAIQDPQQRAAFGAATLGKAWAEVAPLLNEGAVGIGNLIDKGKALSGVTESMVQDAARFNDKLDELGIVVQGAGTRIAGDLLPMLNLLVDDLTATGSGASKAASDFSLLKEIIRALVVFGGEVSFTFKAIGGELGLVVGQIGDMVSAVGSFFVLDFKGGMAKIRNAIAMGDMANDEALKARAAHDLWIESWIKVGTTAEAVDKQVGGSADEMLAALAAASEGAEKAKKAAEFLKSEEIAAARKKAAGEAQKATEKEQATYLGLMVTLREKQTINEQEIATGKQLTEGQKALIKFDEEIKSGKLVLNKAHAAEVRTLMEAVEAQEAYKTAAKNTADAVQALADDRKSSIQSAVAEAEAQERLVAEFGLAKSALEKLTLARAEERLAQRAALELDAAEVEYLKQIIAARKRAAASAGALEALEKQKKATEQAAKDQIDFWNSIDRTAHDTFISIMDGGKGAAQRLKDTFKNVFFDWLYQQTIKKWIINVSTSTEGGGAASALGAVSGGGGAGISSWISAGKAIYSGFSTGIAGSLGGMIGELGGLFGSQAISTFGAGMSLTGAQAATAAQAYGAAGMAGTGSALSAGASAASIVPIVGWVVAGMMANNKFFKQGWDMQGQKSDITEMFLKQGAAGNPLGGIGASMTVGIGAANTVLRKLGLSEQGASLFSGSSLWARAFGRGAPTTEAAGIQGAVSAGGFNGQAFADILQKGGWFRSDKRSTQTTALGATQQSGLDDMIKGMVLSLKGFGSALGAETSAIDGYNKQIKLTLGKDEAENAKAIAELFGGIGDEMALLLVPSLTALATEGERASDTLQRVSTNYMALDAVLYALGDTFGAVGVGSLEARERFLGLAGGIEALAANAQVFADNFMTEAERLAPVQKHVTEQMAALGLSAVTTREQFKATAMALDLTNEEQAKTYVGLMALAGAFAQVTPAAEGVTEAMRTTAEQRAAIQKEIDQLGMTQAQKDRAEIEATNLSLYDLLQARKAERQAIEDTRQAALLERTRMENALKDSIGDAFGEVETLVEAQKRAEKEAFQEVMRGIDTSISKVNIKIERLRNLSVALAAVGPGSQTPQQVAASGQVAQAQILAALAIARTSGVLPSADSLKFALANINGEDSGQFATREEFQRSQRITANGVAELARITGVQMTIEELTLRALQDMRSATQRGFDAQIYLLDDILTQARKQMEEALKDSKVRIETRDAVLTIPAAIAALGTAIRTYQTATAPAPTGDAATPTAMLEHLYSTLFGRAGDAAGLSFWMEELQRGVSLEQIKAQFLLSPEYKALQLAQTAQTPVVTPGAQNSTMAQGNIGDTLREGFDGLNGTLGEIRIDIAKTASNTGQGAQASTQMAQQFDNVTAGGNVLLTEVV